MYISVAASIFLKKSLVWSTSCNLVTVKKSLNPNNNNDKSKKTQNQGLVWFVWNLINIKRDSGQW